MKERIRHAKPNDEGHELVVEETSVDAELLELTQSEPEAVRETIGNLKKEFENAPKTGATLGSDSLYNRARREFVIPLVSAEQKERLLDNLTNLGIYPWEDNATLIIDHRKDLEKLRLAGFITPEIEPQPPFVPTYVPEIEPIVPSEKPPVRQERIITVDEEIREVLEKLTKRARPDHHAFPYPETRGKAEPIRVARGQDEHTAEELRDGDPIEMDDELKMLVNAFDAGDADITDSPRFKARFGDLPTLSLFPQKWVYVHGEMYDKHTGAHISKTDRDAVLKRAKEGDKRALGDVIRMNIGLALKAYGRVWEKQGGSDLQPDDLFQEALIGLNRAVEKYDPAISAFSTYAFLRMEQYMRRFIQEKRRVIHLPAHTSHIRSRYHKLKRQLEQAGPLDRRALAASLSDSELMRGIPTEVSLDRFERTYYINSTFSPVEESFSDMPNTAVTLEARPMTVEPGHSSVEDSQRHTLIQKVLQNLSGSEEFMLRMRFGIRASERIDIRRLVGQAFMFSIPEETIKESSTDELLKRARSVVEDKRTGRTPRFLALIEKINEARTRDLTDDEVGACTPIERLFLAAYGCLTPQQTDSFEIAHDATLEEVGSLYGTQRERVRQIEAKALRHLIHPANSKQLQKHVSGRASAAG